MRRLAGFLASHHPIPLDVAYLLAFLVDNPNPIPTRLRSEHPGSFEAALIAARVEGGALGQHRQAFEAAMGLVTDTLTSEQSVELSRVLSASAEELDGEAWLRMSRTVHRLLPAGHPLLKLLEAEELLRDNKLEDACSVLDQAEDRSDPHWLQLRACCHREAGETDAATELMMAASHIAPAPPLLRKAADVAYECGRFNDAEDVLRRLLAVEPQDSGYRHNLALVYAQLQDFGRAAEQFTVLRQQEPDDPWHGLNQAAALVQRGDLTHALSVFEELCDSPEPGMEAVVGRAQVLKALGRPGAAFDALAGFREACWADVAFLMTFMDMAYASDNERAGHQAFLQLRSLQEQGKAGPHVLQAVSIDVVKRQIEEAHEHHAKLNDGILHGRCPWLLAESVLQRVPYWGWRIRTQPLQWISEEPFARAEYAVYSTNAFGVFEDDDGLRRLLPLECPSRGTRVVVDQSALITLHRLGLLEAAAEYFGRMVLPASYLSRYLEESSRLVPHQLSQRSSLEQVKAAMDSHELNIATRQTNGHGSLPRVDEHASPDDGPERCYRLVDIIRPLYDSGKMDMLAYDDVGRVARRESGADEQHPPLALGDRVVIALSTLQTLCGVGLLGAVLRDFRASILQSDADEVTSGVRAFASQEEVYRQHRDLWQFVREDGRFTSASPVQHGVRRQDDEGPEADASIQAVILAQAMELPLLADDRVCQAVAIGAAGRNRSCTFGTDCFAARVLEDGHLDEERAADLYLQLVDWRQAWK